MANILDLITVGEKKVYVVDGDPSATSGTSAEIASIAMYDNGTVGTLWLKVGAADTAWDKISTQASGNVKLGAYRRLAIYDTSATGYSVADQISQNSNAIDIIIETQAARSTPIEYLIPNPGNAIAAASFVLTEGAQTINGDKTFNDDIVVQGDLTVNGTLTSINTVNTQIKDKLVLLNYGGGIGSAGGSGIAFEEAVQASVAAVINAPNVSFEATAVGPLGNGKTITIVDSGLSGLALVSDNGTAVVVDLGGAGPVNAATFNAIPGLLTINMVGSGSVSLAEGPLTTSGGLGSVTGGFLVSSDRMGFTFDAPGSSYDWTLDSSALTASRLIKMPNESGRMLIQSDSVPGVVGQLSFYKTVNSLGSATAASADSLFWDQVNSRLGIGNAAPSVALHVTGSARITGLNVAGVVHNDANGLLSTSAVSLTADVSGILPVANGGTNSSTALVGKQIMVSNTGATAIVEAGAMTNGQLLIGSLNAQPVIATLSEGANQGVTIVNGAGSITLSTVQDIRTTASPSFVNATLSGKTLGSVIFAGTAGALDQDNSVFFYDATNHRLGLGNAAPSQRLHVTGNELIDGSGSYLRLAADADFKVSQATVPTTDATVTTAATIAIPTGASVMLEFRVVGRRTGGTAGAAGDAAAYVRTARFKNVAGTAVMRNLQSDYTSEDQAGWNCILDVDGGANARCRVTGAANNNIRWDVTILNMTNA